MVVGNNIIRVADLMLFVGALIAEQSAQSPAEGETFMVSPIFVLRRMGFKQAWGMWADIDKRTEFCVCLEVQGSMDVYKFNRQGTIITINNKPICPTCAPRAVSFPQCKSCAALRTK